jgi:hypothetical protein
LQIVDWFIDEWRSLIGAVAIADWRLGIADWRLAYWGID